MGAHDFLLFSFGEGRISTSLRGMYSTWSFMESWLLDAWVLARCRGLSLDTDNFLAMSKDVRFKKLLLPSSQCDFHNGGGSLSWKYTHVFEIWARSLGTWAWEWVVDLSFMPECSIGWLFMHRYVSFMYTLELCWYKWSCMCRSVGKFCIFMWEKVEVNLWA